MSAERFKLTAHFAERDRDGGRLLADELLARCISDAALPRDRSAPNAAG